MLLMKLKGAKDPVRVSADLSWPVSSPSKHFTQHHMSRLN